MVFLLFILGAALGSFLHVVAERYMTSRNAFSGRSYCPHCKKTLSAFELVPILSYVLSRAECRSCKAEIPVHYPILELLTGVVTVALFMPVITSQSGMYVAILAYIIACILVVLIRIDTKHMLLPDGFIYLLAVIGMLYGYFSGRDFSDCIFGILAGSGALYLLWVGTGGRGIGFGDVKLMIPLGIVFGLQGVVTLLFISFFSGGVVGVFLLASGRVTPKTAIPFGPFLAGSALFLLVFPAVVGRFFAILGVY